LSVESYFSQERKKIEKWFQDLPETVKSDMMARLQSENKQQHFGVYYELVTRDFFKKLGYSVEIHPRFGKEEPDLLISGMGLQKPIVIEVATVFDDPEWQKEDQKLSKLLSNLENIQHFYFLGIVVNSVPIPNNIDYNSLVQFVSDWFDRFDPRITEDIQEEKYVKDGLNLTLTLMPKKKSARKKKSPIIGSFSLPARWIGHQQLRNALKNKIKKYKFVKERRFPYLIAISLFETHSNNNNVVDQILGKNVLTIYRNAKGDVVKQQQHRDSSGICKHNQNTRLSGVITVKPKRIMYESDNWIMRHFITSKMGHLIQQRFPDIFEKYIRDHHFSLIHNPYCAITLNDNFMNGYPQFKKTEESVNSFTYSWVDTQTDLPLEK
jgi:hypothetical protein